MTNTTAEVRRQYLDKLAPGAEVRWLPNRCLWTKNVNGGWESSSGNVYGSAHVAQFDLVLLVTATVEVSIKSTPESAAPAEAPPAALNSSEMPAHLRCQFLESLAEGTVVRWEHSGVWKRVPGGWITLYDDANRGTVWSSKAIALYPFTVLMDSYEISLSATPAEVLDIPSTDQAARAAIPVDSLKATREALCVAQTALLNTSFGTRGEINRITAMINEIDRMRPLGQDGVHGDRHTSKCRCSERGMS